jgi:hypothetical protein
LLTDIVEAREKDRAMGLPADGKLIELGYVVRDMAAAANFFGTAMGVGPFVLYEGIAMRDALYLGKPFGSKIDIALGGVGDGTVIELIVHHGVAPSPFHSPEPGQLFRFNHWSTFTGDFEAELVRQAAIGLAPVLTAAFGDDEPARIAYLGGGAIGDCYLELMERDPPEISRTYAEVLARAGEAGGAGRIVLP